MSTRLARRAGGAALCCTVILGCGVDPRSPPVARDIRSEIGANYGVGTGPDAGPSALGKPHLQLSATSVDLGPVAMGFPSRARLTVSNGGDAPLPVPEVSWAEPSDADFSVVHNQCLAEVAPGQRCELRVQFVPSKAGPSAATLRVAGLAVEAANVPFTARGLVAGELLAVPAAGSFENFGEVAVGGNAEAVFSILNPSATRSGALSFSLNQPAFDILPGAPGAAASAEPPCQPGAALPGGASCALRVGFAPSARGPVEATLTMLLDDSGGVSTTLLGEGIVAGVLGTSTGALDFEGVIPGQAAQRSLTIENGGDEPLTLSGAVLEPEGPSLFSILDSNCGAGRELAARERCSVALEFRPTDPDVASTAELVVGAVEGAQERRVALTGVALKPGNLVVTAATPGEENFGDVLLGDHRVRVFTIANPGAQPSGVLNLAATNGFFVDPGALEGDCLADTSLVDNQRCAVHVRFEPTERGAAAGVLTVSSDLAGASSVALSGAALAPAALEVDTEVNFGRVTTGTSGQNVLSIRNTGDQPLPPPTFDVNSSNADHEAAFSLESGCTAPLAFEESCEVALSFAPSLASAHSATLDVVADPGGLASVLLLGQAVAPGTLLLAPSEAGGADFGDVAIGASKASSFTLSNPGGEPAGAVTIRSDVPAFAVTPGDCIAGETVGLVDGASCTFEVSFTPENRQPLVGRLLVLSAALGEVNLELVGRGRSRARLEATAARNLGSSNVSQDPAPLNQFTWVVNNTGDLASGELAVENTNRGEFEVSNDTCSGQAVAARASCQMLIGFRPGEAGPRSGAISASDATSESSVTIQLTGSGQRSAGPGENCVGATCSEGLCTANKCCDRACDRPCQVCTDSGACVDQSAQEACGEGGSARCFGVDQCLLPLDAVCGNDSDCGGGLLCKRCATGGRRCTAPENCCGGCSNGLTCVEGSCGCAPDQRDCGGGLCISLADSAACCPGAATNSCPAAAPKCTAAGRCVQCLEAADCSSCETCSPAGVCTAIEPGQPGRCGEGELCNADGQCIVPDCTSDAGCDPCHSCENFRCQVLSPAGSSCGTRRVCSAGGDCVACLDDTHCRSCEVCGKDNTCEPIARGTAGPRCPLTEPLCDGDGTCFSAPCSVEGSAQGCAECNVCRDFACAVAEGAACSSGVGVCAADGSCGCTQESDCGAAACLSCIGGRCQATPAGQADNCGDGEVCNDSSTCVPAPDCTEESPCGECEECVGGSCQPTSVEDSTCGDGGTFFCNTGGECVQCLIDAHCDVCQRCDLGLNTCELLEAGFAGRCNLDTPGALVCDGALPGVEGCVAPACTSVDAGCTPP